MFLCFFVVQNNSFMPNFWIFQATPDVFNLRNALKMGALRTFSVRSHRQKIQKGDKIILWLTGNETGCYALATVTSEVNLLDFDKKELPYLKNTDNFNIPRDAIQLELEYNLWNNPIFKDELSKDISESLKVNIPGTNFEATQIQYQAFLNIIKMRNAVEEPLVDYQKTKNRTKHPLNLILYGAPGTGKTYHTVNYALSIIEDISLKQLEKEPRGHLLQRFQSYQLEGQIQVVTFHQSFSYEDFIEGIKPQTTDDQQVIYNIEDGIFKNMAQKAANHPHKDRYVLIIDEINRGNVAAIFGELITLIEPEKRIGSLEKVTIQLPYSKIPFAVPSNLYLIGTMNTADRNTEILDNALRRRFDFIEKSPVPSLLTTIETIDLSKLLTVINQRIEILLDRDHVIGHAYLMSVQNISGLQQVFATKIIPLLQEYFYGDWSKIGLILGQHFIKSEYINASSGVFADFDDDGKGDYDGKTIYSVTDRKSWNKETFVSIYE